jgi:serine O-acetyltransferase
MPGWIDMIKRSTERALEDIDAVCKSDPAARTRLDVALVYPGVHALWLHRAAHGLWERDVKLGARLVAHANRFLTGIEIHPAAKIGRRVVIDHGMGVVIGETAAVGDGCVLYKGVVLGGTSLDRRTRHPQVGREVVIGSNACILGAIHIGDGARVGSGSVVIKEVPPGATVVGVPARIIVPRHARFEAALDHAALPDPVADMIRGLAEHADKLQQRIAILEARLGIERDEGSSHSDHDDGAEQPPADGG